MSQTVQRSLITEVILQQTIILAFDLDVFQQSLECLGQLLLDRSLAISTLPLKSYTK